MSNSSTRIPSTLDATDIFEVYEPGDLGVPELAPDGVMRVKLVLGASYNFAKTMVVPLLWVPDTVDPSSVISFLGTHGINLLFAGDDTAHIWGRNIGTLTFDRLTLVDISNGGAGHGTRLFDLVGVSAFSFFTLGLNVFVQFKAMGTLTDVSFIHTGPVGLIRALSGYVLRATPGSANNTVIGATRVESSPADPDMVSAAFSFIGGPPSAIISTLTPRQGKAANSFLHIDAGSTGSYLIVSNHYLTGANFGSFFRPDELLTLTAQADASVVVTSFSDSVTDPGVATSVNFGAIVDLKRGDVILISGEAAYDGPHSIIRVAADLLSFDIAVVHSTSGAGTLAMVEHTVSGMARFVDGETVTIAGTVSYNAVDIQVIRKTGNSTFTLPQTFVGDDAAGTAASSGKDQTFAGVIARANAEQEDSTLLGEACWNGNASNTAITDQVYVPLVLTGVMLAEGSERVTLVDAASARIRNDSEAPIRLALTLALNGEKAGASPADYRVAVSLNGAAPVFATAAYAELQLRDTNKQVTFFPTIQLGPGDEVQPMIAGAGSTTAVTFTSGQFIMRV